MREGWVAGDGNPLHPNPLGPVRSLVSFSIAAAIDQYIAAHSSIREPDGLWHPSSISGCQRKAVYEVRGVEPTDPPTAKQARILFLGSRFHEIVQEAVKLAHGDRVYTEVRILVPELNVTGAADQLILAEQPDGTFELQEFKTIKEWAFRKLTEPKDDHVRQQMHYMFALREHGGTADDGRIVEPLGDRLTQARFTYIEKQTFDTREFVVPWDPAWEADIRRTVDDLEAYKGDPLSLPPRLPTDAKGKKSWMCDWGWGRCQFYSRCWEQDGEGTPPDPDVW